MFTKCANAACPEPFEYHVGGTFFRFFRGNAKSSLDDGSTTEVGNVHDVEHYWLCPRCVRIYTLVFIEGAGVILKPRWQEQLVAELLKRVVAA